MLKARKTPLDELNAILLDLILNQDYRMIVAIGNAPSSGSTFLADILDSLPFAVCGVETNMFAVQNLFTNFNHAKLLKKASSSSPLIYQGRQRYLKERVGAYGIESRLFDIILAEANSMNAFCEEIFNTFSNIRGKTCSIFFEKSPQNIHCAKLFLDMFPDGYFLHIVRNPLYVYKSLKNRKFSEYIARHTWIVDVSAAYALRNHPRFITIRYEDLVKAPFETVIQFLKQIGFTFRPAELERLYHANTYRKTISRKLKSWSLHTYGALGDANKKEITSDDLDNLNVMVQSILSNTYGSLFEMKPVPFSELVSFYGYGYKGLDLTHSRQNDRVDRASRIFLFKKFLFDLWHCDIPPKAFFSYSKPVETCVV